MDQEILENLCYMVWEIISYPKIRALLPSTSHPTSLQYSSYVLSIVTCIIGLAANIMVIFITGFLMKKNKYKIWFLNLALADFTFLLFLPLYAGSVIRGQWSYGSIVCKFYTFLSLVNMYASIYILTALNIDRALSVAKPVWHLRFRSRRFCWCMCAAIWVSSAICNIPAIVYSDGNEEKQCALYFTEINISKEPSTTDYDLGNDTAMFDSFPREWCQNFSTHFEMSDRMKYIEFWRLGLSSALYLTVPLAVLGYVIPLCVILVSNIIIALHVKNSKMAATSRLYRVVVIEVMSFFCVRTPYVLAYIALWVVMYTLRFTVLFKLALILPLLFCISATNSLINPVVYVLVGKQVRSEMVKVFRKRRYLSIFYQKDLS